MDLVLAFLADSVIVQDNKFYIWGGGIDTIYVSSFPGVHPNISLVARVMFEPSECGRPHTVEVSPVDDDGRPVAPGFPPQTIIPQKDLADPTLPVGTTVVIGYQGLPLPEPCKLTFCVLVDGRQIGTVRLRAVQAPGIPAQGRRPASG